MQQPLAHLYFNVIVERLGEEGCGVIKLVRLEKRITKVGLTSCLLSQHVQSYLIQIYFLSVYRTQ